MIVESESLLKSLKDCFISFSLDMQMGEIEDTEAFAQLGLKITKNHGKVADDYFNLTYCAICLFRLSKEFDHLTVSIIRDSNILSQKELALITQIRQSDVLTKLKCQYGVNHLLTEYEVLDFFKEISAVYKKISDLHSIINKRIYKK